MNKDLLLSHIAGHIQLNPEEEELLLSKVKFRKYLKNQFVVQAGDVNKHRSFVTKGCLKTFYLGDEGHEHIVRFAIENWWTGDMESFLTQQPAFYYVQCIEKCDLAQISFEDMEELYTLVPKLERLFRIITQNAYVSSQTRITQNLSLSAKEKYLKFKAQYPQFIERVPQYLIASYLGITPEFLSSIRKELRRN